MTSLSKSSDGHRLSSVMLTSVDRVVIPSLVVCILGWCSSRPVGILRSMVWLISGTSLLPIAIRGKLFGVRLASIVRVP